MKKLLSHITIVLSLLTLISIVQAQSKNTGKYIGSPEKDADFIFFIQKNLGKVVFLKLSLSDNAMISQGYKGVQPSFDGVKVKGISYSFFLECKGAAYNNRTQEYQCADTKWNENSGELSAYFKVSKIIRTSMKNYRAVFLVPVKR